MPPFGPAWALFLDIDGTLLDIAERPDAVRIGAREIALLSQLHRAAHGALALVSGRTLAAIDALVHPLRLPAAGQHGVERRDARGALHGMDFPVEALQRVSRDIESFAKKHDGLVLENKGHSLSLHYRLAPRLGDAVHALMREAAAQLGDWVEVQSGKMVAELKPVGRDKGVAIEEFMREPPFSGRTAVFLGDDITDEHGFRAVNRIGGHSIKVGEGSSAARWRLPDPAAARDWLAAWLAAVAFAHR